MIADAEVNVLIFEAGKFDVRAKEIAAAAPGMRLLAIGASEAAGGSFQAPKSVEFMEAIPQTPVGKPDKKALRVIAG